MAGIEQVAMGMQGTEEREWLSVEAKKMPTSHEEIKGDSEVRKTHCSAKGNQERTVSEKLAQERFLRKW